MVQFVAARSGQGGALQCRARLGSATWGRRLVLVILIGVVGLGLVVPAVSSAQPPPLARVETRLSELPPGSRYWRVETYPSRADAEAAAGPTGLVIEVAGQVWLFTLGPKGYWTPGGEFLAEIGPLPEPPAAAEYVLVAQEGVSAPGVPGEVHTHPGVEAWYVVEGEQTVCTAKSATRTIAGGTAIGPPAGVPMSLTNTGDGPHRRITLLLLDAGQPRSSPADPLPADAPCRV